MGNDVPMLADFVSRPKSLLIAPAGYGKTHSIAECLKFTKGTQLILTHTHAGVASLKEKIKKSGVPSKSYQVETIDSYAQKYVEAFYTGTEIPEQDESSQYFPAIRKKASEIIKRRPIKEIIASTYSSVFVDEYQDCTLDQHQFVLALSDILPTHILGDSVQGIFGFNQQIVDWEQDLILFKPAQFKLEEPWRWKNKNPELGEALKKIRDKIENNQSINLNEFNTSIETHRTGEADIYNHKEIWKLLDQESNLLFIHPDCQNINSRKEIVKRYNNTLSLVEAMDGKDFYAYSKEIDECQKENAFKLIHKLAIALFNKTELDKWFNDDGPKSKRDDNDKKLVEPIKINIDALTQSVSLNLLSHTIKLIKTLPGIKCYRKELCADLCRAIILAEHNKTKVHEAMIKIRNAKRRMGRKIIGRCIGTTLLTKGLEFDAVAILNAHKFECPKNFYVAITRASKRLVVFTANPIIRF